MECVLVDAQPTAETCFEVDEIDRWMDRLIIVLRFFVDRSIDRS